MMIIVISTTFYYNWFWNTSIIVIESDLKLNIYLTYLQNQVLIKKIASFLWWFLALIIDASDAIGSLASFVSTIIPSKRYGEWEKNIGELGVLLGGMGEHKVALDRSFYLTRNWWFGLRISHTYICTRGAHGCRNLPCFLEPLVVWSWSFGETKI
jgi:hypothetical protein